MEDKTKKVPKNLKNYIKCLCIKCPSSNKCMKIRLEKLYCSKGPTKCDFEKKGCLCPECQVAKDYDLDQTYYCK